MLGLNNKIQADENIKNPPSSDSYPIVSGLFSKDRGFGVNVLSLTVLDLINEGQIKCDIDLEDSYEVGKKLTAEDMEVMKKITLRIANKGELKTSETLAINLLKNMNSFSDVASAWISTRRIFAGISLRILSIIRNGLSGP